MKRFIFCLTVLSALVCAACSREDLDPAGSGSGEQTVRLTLSLPDPPTVKTTLGARSGSVYPVLWAEGDQLSLNGNLSHPLTASQAGSRSAGFIFKGSIVAPFNILYPASSETDKVVFPEVQKYVAGSFDPAALPMYASTDSYDDAVMSHLGTLLCFPFRSETPVSLKQLIVMSLDSKPLSGEFVLEKDGNGRLTGAFASASGVPTVSLSFPDGGLPLGTEALPLYVSVPSGTYPKGMLALAISTDDKTMTMSFLTKEAVSHTLQAGSLRLFPETAFNPGAALFLIDEPADLAALAANPADYQDALVIADIDMSASDWTPIEGFSGVLNGAGHQISGLSAPLFGKLEGEVKNLVLDSDIRSEAPVTGVLAREIDADAKVTSCTVKGSLSYTGASYSEVLLGGLAGTLSGTLSGCTGSVALSLPAETAQGSTFVFAGGLVGRTLEGSLVTGCTHDGTVSAAASVRSAQCAGVVAENNGTVEGCTHSGTVVFSAESASDLYVAGIAAVTSGTVKDCIASGSVLFDKEGTCSAEPFVGGVVAKSLSGTVSDCSLAEGGRVAWYGDGADSGNGYLGGVVAHIGGASLNGLVSSGSVTLDGYSYRPYVGGVLGFASRNEPLSLEGFRTTETAAVNLVTPLLKGTQILQNYGGLFGYAASGELSIRDCHNAAAIRLTVPEEAGSARLLMGGIVGYVYSGLSQAEATISGCTNTGDITVDGKTAYSTSASARCLVGGILGWGALVHTADNTVLTLENCVNEGDISFVNATDASRTYVGGIAAELAAASMVEKGCVNCGDITMNGYLDRCCIAGHIGIVWRSVGSSSELYVEGLGETPVNTGTLSYHDGAKCNRHPVAGGVIGLLMAQTGHPLETKVIRCTNAGMIDRVTPADATFKAADPSYEASAGGIIGNIGYQSNSVNYGYQEVTVEDCVNTAQLTINAYAGDDVFVEKTLGQSFLGGIVGISHAANGLVTVRNCRNSGYMRITAGNAGGIVGRIQTNTVVTGSKTAEGVQYTYNEGRVGEIGLDTPLSFISSGYVYAGGIVGSMQHNGTESLSKIEYCYNAADICGSHATSATDAATTRPCAGGIIGEYVAGRSYAAVRWCKNSGHIRNYVAAKGKSLQYSGLISGASAGDKFTTSGARRALVRDCGVGGTCLRSTGWILPTPAGGEYPFYNYIYCVWSLTEDGSNGYPVTTEEGTGCAEGCVYWNGTDSLPWEE